ncbi:hypothetical protein A4H34_09780 [Peptidiphaga gingivicola]|uniref:Uncharacterized protein n=1 Tax=Peptidiphaga gingivicola TaxID=2741497 RepID=A0A179B2B2_9ACTO|nr:hypothetical protein A4H34_09780 [Peptidiphaga gingivicola]
MADLSLDPLPRIPVAREQLLKRTKRVGQTARLADPSLTPLNLTLIGFDHVNSHIPFGGKRAHDQAQSFGRAAVASDNTPEILRIDANLKQLATAVAPSTHIHVLG